jgi:hypothetical protein
MAELVVLLVVAAVWVLTYAVGVLHGYDRGHLRGLAEGRRLADRAWESAFPVEEDR